MGILRKVPVYVVLLYQFAAAATTMPTHVQVWDFSQSHNVSMVPWPGKWDVLFPLRVVVVSGPAIIRFSSTQEFSGEVERIAFCRDQNQLAYVTLSLPAQSVESALKTASDLAAYWKLPSESIEEWHRAALQGQLHSCLAANHDVMPAVDLEIHLTLNDQFPVAITMTFGWPQSSGSSPASRP